MPTKVIKIFLNGAIFGITQTVPGVSAGTVAIILGFYNELLEAVNHFFKDIRKYTMFLFPMLMGAAVGLLVFSSVIQFLLARYSFPTMLFFIGLIVGIIPPVCKKATAGGKYGFKAYYAAYIVIPIIILVLISHTTTPEYAVNPSEVFWQVGVPYMLFLLAGGFVAGSSLLLPGVSGSFVLLLMGIYPVAIYAVASARFLLSDITNIALMLNIGMILAPLGIGTVLGALATARLIEKLLKEYEQIVYLAILGLLVGSVYALLRTPIVWQSGTDRIVISIVVFCAGCVMSFKLDRV